MKVLSIILFLCFMLGLAGAISSQEAKDFLTSESHFLEEGQSIEILPNFPVQYNKEKFWVAVIITEESPSGFLAVKYSAKEISLNKTANTELFKTVYVLRSLKDYKEKNSAVWVFASSNKTFFQTLNSVTSGSGSVYYTLGNISDELNTSDARTLTNEMSAILSEMSSRAFTLEEKTDEIIKVENDFVNSTNTSQTNALKEKYDEFFPLLEEINSLRQDYENKTVELKTLISKSDKTAGEKQQLIALASSPQEFQKLDSIAKNSSDLYQGIQSIYAKAISNVSTWVDNVDSMKKRNDAYNLLYSDDPDLYKKTKNYFSKLNDLVKFILDENNKPYWKEYEKIDSMQSNWNKAELNFKQKKYENVQTYALKAKNDAVTIFQGGFVQQGSDMQNLIIYIAVGLIVLLVALMLFKNRNKLFPSPTQAQKEQEIIPYGWQKS
ncbi:MAG: hypothetical protein AB1467_02355 [Candidatus Diapherotrites archaeon]